MAKLTREEAAIALGMKAREVVDLVAVRGGTVVQTHDGVQTLVTDDGAITPYVRPPLAESAEAVTEDPDAVLDVLRAEAEALGVKVDKRWSADRLAKEIDARKSSGA